jgi:hypothetical protein
LSETGVPAGHGNSNAEPWRRFGVSRALGFLVFFAFFFGMLFLFNLYVLTRLFAMLGLGHGILFLIFTLASSMSFAIAMMLRNAMSCSLTKGYYFGAATWLGFLIYMLFASAIYDVLGRFIDFERPLVPYAFIAAAAALVLASLAVPRFVALREIEVRTAKLDRKLRILHMSDLHIGASHGPRGLEKLVMMANETKPDLVLITGDLADSPMDPKGDPFAALDRLEAPAFFVIGNHEHYAGIEDVSALLAKTKVRVLRNEVAVSGDVQIVGADYGGAKELEHVLSEITLDRSKYTVLMFHQPDGFDVARAASVDLMLCGHTHGGQFFPFTIINRLIWGKEFYGHHERGGMHIHTTSGAGTWGPPMRLGTRSEMVLIKVNGKG